MTVHSCFRVSVLAALAMPPALLALLLTFLCAAAPAHAQHEPAKLQALGTIAGTVSDKHGMPLAGIHVDFYSGEKSRRTATTGIDGRYSAPLVTGIYRIGFADPRGSYVQQFYSGEALLQDASEIAIAGNIIGGIDAQLSKAGIVTGTVHVSARGNELAAYTWRGDHWQLAQEASFGAYPEFEISGLPAGTYRVCFARPIINSDNVVPCYRNVVTGLEDASDIAVAEGEVITGIEILGDDVSTIDIYGTAPYTVAAPRAGTGAITGKITGLPPIYVPSVYRSVAIFAQEGSRWHSVKTIDLDAAHRYQATDLPPGSYRICLAHNEITGEGGPCYDRIGGGVEWATDISVQAGQFITGIDLPLGNFVDGAALSGAIAGEGGVPLSNVYVELQRWLGNGYQWGMVAVTRTNAAGLYRIDDIPPGNYVFRLWDLNDFYLPCESGCSSSAHTETITLQRYARRENVNFQMTPGGVITGAVTFGGPFPAAAAVIGATAKADDVVGGEYTVYGKYDPDSGHYAIGPLPPGMYHMVAEIPPEYEMPYSGFFTKVRYDAPIEISVTNGSNIGNVDIHFADGEYDGIMTGMVSNLDNEPLAGIRVELLQDITNYMQVFVYTQTDKNGQYGLGGLPTGRYRVRFVDPDGIYLPAYARKIGQPTNVHLLAASEFTEKLYIPIVSP